MKGLEAEARPDAPARRRSLSRRTRPCTSGTRWSANAFEESRRLATPAAPKSKPCESTVENRNDTQTGMLSGVPESARCVQRFDDSLEICNSHYISRFAAFFIDARAKRSVAESCNSVVYILALVYVCVCVDPPQRTMCAQVCVCV